MNEYYEPTLLFRQNAVKKNNSEVSPMSSVSSFETSDSANSSSTWLLDGQYDKDTEILNKSCSLNRVNIKSNYWKIPDNDMNLTSMAVNKQDDDSVILGISSANKDSNLFIYELDLAENYLTHHNTISLPNIHAMKWVPQNKSQGMSLITGNSKGYAHLVTIPQSNEDGESAEIVKRFNHRKHLKSINKDPSIQSHASTNINKLGFMNSSTNLVSLYDDNLFLWDIKDSDSQIKPKPTLISSIPEIKNFDPITNNLNLVGICGKFGVSLFDTRNPKFSVPSSSMRGAKRRELAANVIRWSPTNENVFAAGHLDGITRLWDIRKQESFGSLNGHHGKKIVSMEWNNDDLFTAGKDGNIVHWDLTSDINEYPEAEFMNCGLKEGLNSVTFNPTKNSVEDTISQRQCGTILPASNTNIVDMCSLEYSSKNKDEVKVLSIDSSSFFGAHSKIYDAVKVNINQDKLYYTEEDMSLLMTAEQASGNSLSTLVNSSVDNVTKPLAISRSPTAYKTIVVPQTPNMSSETLTGHHEDEFVEVADYSFAHPKFSFTNPNESAYSVDSAHNITLSPNSSASSDMFNESLDSLSTNQTIVDASPITHKRDPSDLFNFDFSVDFDDLKQYDSIDINSMNRMASIRTAGTNYYSLYSS